MKNYLGLAATIAFFEFAFVAVSCSNSSSSSAGGFPYEGGSETTTKTYTVTIANDIINGSITTDKTNALAGAIIGLYITPANGYQLESLVVTCSDNSNVTTTGGGWSHGFTMPAQNVVVHATFDEAYINFGTWPQTIKANNITINENETEVHGSFTYFKGSDGEWYVKMLENGSYSDAKYSDGTSIAQKSANSWKWFKVEPIKWRILTKDNNGKKLLLADKVLIGSCYDSIKNNYKDSEIRTWLTGEFHNTAFILSEQEKIISTVVDNSARSTNSDKNATERNGGKNKYACENTNDKIFLLSVQEVTSGYHFEKYNTNDVSNAKIKNATDFAKASGVSIPAIDKCGNAWWLRSPSSYNENEAHYVHYYCITHPNGVDELLFDIATKSVKSNIGGIAPALWVTN